MTWVLFVAQRNEYLLTKHSPLKLCMWMWRKNLFAWQNVKIYSVLFTYRIVRTFLLCVGNGKKGGQAGRKAGAHMDKSSALNECEGSMKAIGWIIEKATEEWRKIHMRRGYQKTQQPIFIKSSRFKGKRDFYNGEGGRPPAQYVVHFQSRITFFLHLLSFTKETNIYSSYNNNTSWRRRRRGRKDVTQSWCKVKWRCGFYENLILRRECLVFRNFRVLLRVFLIHLFCRFYSNFSTICTNSRGYFLGSFVHVEAAEWRSATNKRQT